MSSRMDHIFLKSVDSPESLEKTPVTSLTSHQYLQENIWMNVLFPDPPQMHIVFFFPSFVVCLFLYIF